MKTTNEIIKLLVQCYDKVVPTGYFIDTFYLNRNHRHAKVW